VTTATGLDVQFDPAAHEYRVSGAVWPSVTQVLRAVGLSTDWSRLPPLVREAAERKRDLGQKVHDATKLLDQHDLSWGSLDDDIFPYVEAWESYTKDRGIVDFLAVEEVVAHPLLSYAGTLDRFASLDHGYVLPDIKIGDPDDAGGRFQVAAYLEAYLQGHPELRTERIQLECVRLFPTGKYAVDPYKSTRDDWKVFQAALTVFKAQPTRR
jgi:hypothetical protein